MVTIAQRKCRLGGPQCCRQVHDQRGPRRGSNITRTLGFPRPSCSITNSVTTVWSANDDDDDDDLQLAVETLCSRSSFFTMKRVIRN